MRPESPCAVVCLQRTAAQTKRVTSVFELADAGRPGISVRPRRADFGATSCTCRSMPGLARTPTEAKSATPGRWPARRCGPPIRSGEIGQARAPVRVRRCEGCPPVAPRRGPISHTCQRRWRRQPSIRAVFQLGGLGMDAPRRARQNPLPPVRARSPARSPADRAGRGGQACRRVVRAVRARRSAEGGGRQHAKAEA